MIRGAINVQQLIAESSPKVSPRVEISNEHAVRSHEVIIIVFYFQLFLLLLLRIIDPPTNLCADLSQGGSVYRDVETKTFKILKQQLPESEAGGTTPSSLWDRSMEDRSDYLKASGPTYQKAYGEK